MLIIENSIELGAPPWRVWKILTSLDGYARWHPFIQSAGDPTPGAHVDYVFRNSSFRRSFAAAATIILNDEPVAFGWRIGLNGILALDETFHIEPGEQGVKLRHMMTGRGFLACLPLHFMERRLRTFIVKTDEALARHLRGAAKPPPRPGNRKKRRIAESRARHSPPTRGRGA